MINQIKKWISGGQEDFITPKETVVIFKLSYQNLLVGELKLEFGKWSFQYSEDFKNQDKLKPLPDFPSLEKVYESEELYPFFLHRIPSIKQPKVQKEIKENNLDATNEVDLLKFFGRESISNPYLLRSA